MKPEVILFDLGGVLVELTGVPVMHEWSNNRFDDESLWHAWLHSTSVRAFERGTISAQQFAEDIVAEWALDISAEDFIAAFTYWPSGLFPGAYEMLSELRNKPLRLACLSNSNELHWPRIMGEMQLDTLIDEHFASHQLGMLKPDAEVFDCVLDQLDCAASDVLFLDDNLLNVTAARKAGMNAFRTRGIGEVKAVLAELGISDGKR